MEVTPKEARPGMATTPVKKNAALDMTSSTHSSGMPMTPGAPCTPSLQVAGSGGLLSAHGATPLTQPVGLGAGRYHPQMTLATPENPVGLSQQGAARAGKSGAKMLDAWDSDILSPFKRRCLDQDLNHAAKGGASSLPKGPAPVKGEGPSRPMVDFQSMVGLGMQDLEAQLSEEEEDEICTLQPPAQPPFKIPELIGKLLKPSQDQRDAHMLEAHMKPPVAPKCRVTDFGALVGDAKADCSCKTRLDELVETLDLKHPLYFEEDNALLESSSDEEEDQPCVLRQPQAHPPQIMSSMFFQMMRQGM